MRPSGSSAVAASSKSTTRTRVPRRSAKRTKLAKVNRKPNELDGKLNPGQTPSEANAEMLVEGLMPNVGATWEWSAYPFGKPQETVDITATLRGVMEASERVKAGDLGDLEGVLTAQIFALNTAFANLLHKANATELFPHLESYLRLAFKAQSQCRTTAEALAVIKRPPVFTKQANIASQQVVNNGTMVSGSRHQNPQTAQNEQMEAQGERLDGRTAPAAISSHSTVETVGTLNRPPDHGRQGTVITKRLQRRRKAGSA